MANELTIEKISITQVKADCIVNAANSALQQGGGVCGAIFREAGADRLQRACNAFGFCPTGSAIMTPGFDLQAKWIAHAVGPQWQGGSHREAQKLRSCYQTVLQQAGDKGCHTVAFPLISAGIYGYPPEQAWEVALSAILDYFAAHSGADLQVTMAVLDDEMYTMGKTILHKIQAVQTPSPEAPHVSVSDMVPNRNITGFYILQSAAIRTTTAGKVFLSGTVSDRTGSVPVIFWDYAGALTSSDEGKIVKLRGHTAEFKGALQITLDEIREETQEDTYDMSALVPVAPIDADQMYRDIQAIIQSLTDPDYQAVCREALRRHEKEFLSIPAAKSIHHGFLHGLLMHTGYMVKSADFLSGLYQDVIDRNLLITGTLLHDFAKIQEFTFSSLGLVTDYSVKGELLGHLVMGAQEVKEICNELSLPEEKSVLLQHMLLSHHGKPEYGAAVTPMCAESELLSLIDMMDSRMEIYRETLEQTPVRSFSNRVFALDGSRVYHHYDHK